MTYQKRLLSFAFVAVMVTACTKATEVPKVEPPTLNVTDWTDKTELYMEYPPLVAGQSARFAVHLTTLADFKALNAGTPSLEFLPEGGGSPTNRTPLPT